MIENNNTDSDDCEAISYVIEELDSNNNEIDLEELINKINKLDQDDMRIPHMLNYQENYTVKELLLICEYYNLSKSVRACKLNKEEIVNFLTEFESDILNAEIVNRRQTLWFYINELKQDKFMKKFILW